MGYRLDYAPLKKVRGLEGRTVRLPALIGAAFLLFVILVTVFWPEGRELMRQLVIPGDPAVTVGALAEMAGELRSGGTIGEAVQVFCVQILEGAGFGSG